MLMPDKHIRFAESLVGLGSFVLEVLDEPKTIDELWILLGRHEASDTFPAAHSFENLVLTIDALFAIGALTEDVQTGVLRKCA